MNDVVFVRRLWLWSLEVCPVNWTNFLACILTASASLNLAKRNVSALTFEVPFSLRILVNSSIEFLTLAMLVHDPGDEQYSRFVFNGDGIDSHQITGVRRASERIQTNVRDCVMAGKVPDMRNPIESNQTWPESSNSKEKKINTWHIEKKKIAHAGIRTQ